MVSHALESTAVVSDCSVIFTKQWLNQAANSNHPCRLLTWFCESISLVMWNSIRLCVFASTALIPWKILVAASPWFLIDSCGLTWHTTMDIMCPLSNLWSLFLNFVILSPSGRVLGQVEFMILYHASRRVHPWDLWTCQLWALLSESVTQAEFPGHLDWNLYPIFLSDRWAETSTLTYCWNFNITRNYKLAASYQQICLTGNALH